MLRSNLAEMASALPGDRLRPHVKAHKCTSLARLQADHGHRGFTCATIAEMEAMAGGRARRGPVARQRGGGRDAGSALWSTQGAKVTLAVDSEATIDAAATGGVRRVLIDVNVGLPRCGCRPGDAGRLADLARSRRARGARASWATRATSSGWPTGQRARAGVEASMSLLSDAHSEVGGDIVSARRYGNVRHEHLGDRDTGGQLRA